MERTEIDGVLAVWAPGPPPLRATLSFGCGARDEQFRTIGVTHLIGHLAMSALGRVHYEHNGTVDLELTSFTAVGRPEQITDFVERICAALGDLPVDRIHHEAGVLAAEGGWATHPTAAALLARRFGYQAYGLAPLTGPGSDRIDADAVRAHAARYFVAGNAVLQLTGPPPPTMRLPLPEGPRAVHPMPEPIRPDGPRWSAEPVPGPGISLLGARADPAWAMAMAILLWVDARDGTEAEVARILWETTVQLATDGLNADELAEEVTAAIELFADPRYIEIELEAAAHAELLSYPHQSSAQHAAQLPTVTGAEVSARLAEALMTALLVVPSDITVKLTGLDGRPVAEGGCPRARELPRGRVFKPPGVARLVSRAARGLRLVLTRTRWHCTTRTGTSTSSGSAASWCGRTQRPRMGRVRA